MKSFIFRIYIIAIGVFASSDALADEPTVPFFPALLDAIHAYKKTQPVKLPKPDPEKHALLDDAKACPPGFMPYTRNVIINKEKRRLSVVTPHGDVLQRFDICASKNRGQKRRKDDCKTPEGVFQIIGIYNSTDWTYKDTDQKAYGPYFVHLNTQPFYGIGIHGTSAPGSIPGRSSHGCLRMTNDNITLLRKMLFKDSRVTILSDTVQDITAEEGRRTGETVRGARKPIITYSVNPH